MPAERTVHEVYIISEVYFQFQLNNIYFHQEMIVYFNVIFADTNQDLQFSKNFLADHYGFEKSNTHQYYQAFSIFHLLLYLLLFHPRFFKVFY